MQFQASFDKKMFIDRHLWEIAMMTDIPTDEGVLVSYEEMMGYLRSCLEKTQRATISWSPTTIDYGPQKWSSRLRNDNETRGNVGMNRDKKLKTRGVVHDTVTGYDFRQDTPLNRSLAIRRKCLECVGLSAPDVKSCHIHDCTLWPWRMGGVGKVGEDGKARVSDVEAELVTQ